MEKESVSSGLLGLLNQAIARELQVSIQYMFQHSLGTAWVSEASGKTLAAKRSKFVASQSSIWLPGSTLKKIAITEMRHAEAIAARVVLLGGEPTTQPSPITLGKSAVEILENDREQERGAIELYRQIISVAGEGDDAVTGSLFQRILRDEESHFSTFAKLLGGD